MSVRFKCFVVDQNYRVLLTVLWLTVCMTSVILTKGKRHKFREVVNDVHGTELKGKD